MLSFAAATSAIAQKPEEVAYFHLNRVKSGMVAQYETTRKQHWLWHKRLGDTWSFYVWQIVSGEATGAYVVSSFGHTWKESFIFIVLHSVRCYYPAQLALADSAHLRGFTPGGMGHAGKSYNTFNSDLKRWEQFWVDDTAGMIHFYVHLKDGVMDYWTDEIPQPDGTKLKRHLQFIPPGTGQVRQFSQGSTDGGNTWTVEYDLTYHRKK